jgi:RNA polymerase sigma-70 factor (ECF subfamily)
VISLFLRKPRRKLGSAAEGAGTGRPPSDEFAAAVIAHLPRLRRYAIALVGDLSLADDLVQDCAERALRYRTTLKEEPRVFGWLRKILHNLYIDELRHRRRAGTAIDLDELANSLAQSVPSAERMSTVDFVRAMSGLSVEHRQILLLVGLEGTSYRDAAEELKIPVGTVMSRLARARTQLRALLDQAESGSGKLPNRHPIGKVAD